MEWRALCALASHHLVTAREESELDRNHRIAPGFALGPENVRKERTIPRCALRERPGGSKDTVTVANEVGPGR